MTTHIRARMPRKGGNSFYRDKNNYSKFCVTLCGAAVTDRDIDYATANTKKFRAGGWSVCVECRIRQDEMQAAVIAATVGCVPKDIAMTLRTWTTHAGQHIPKAEHDAQRAVRS